MAQLKVKQISDFVSAVTGIHNGSVGTAAGSAISDAKSLAISTAVSADVVAKSEAISAAVSADVVVLSSAKSYADQAELDAISSAVSQAEAKDVVRAATAVTNIATAKSEAISAAVSADVVVLSNAKKYTDDEIVKVNDKITTEQGRIDAILEAAEADADSFAEIVALINSVDLTNDNALGTAVLSLATVDSGLASRITTLENSSTASDLTALEARVTTNEGDISANARDISDLADRVSTNEGDISTNASDISDLAGRVSTNETNITSIVDVDIVNINNTLNSFGDIVSYNYSSVTTDIETAYNNAVSAASSYADGLAGNYDAAGSAAAALTAAKTYADTAESDAITSANGYTDTAIATLDADLQGQIDALSGVSSDEVVAAFGSATEFSTAKAFALNGHLVVFVNGLQIHEAAEGIDGWSSVNGRNFTVAGLGYELEADDHIIVSGTLATV